MDNATATYRPRLIPSTAIDAKSADAKSKTAATAAAATAAATDIKAGGKRADGRIATQLRPLCLKTSVVSQAHGSAYVEIGATKVICGVYGPRQSKKMAYSDNRGALWCDFKYAPFALEQRRRRGQEPDERHFSIMLVEALEVSVMLDKFPKSVLEAYVTVLEADAGVLSAAITCVSLALADAGIEMYDLVAACSVGVLSGASIVDPSRAESLNSQYTASVVCAFMPSLQQITHFAQSGQTEQTDVTQLVELSVDSCTKLHSLMRECLIASLQKKLASKQTALSFSST